MSTKTLYERLGGYDAISAVANDLLPRLRPIRRLRALLGASRGGRHPARAPLIDYLCASEGGPNVLSRSGHGLCHRRHAYQ